MAMTHQGRTRIREDHDEWTNEAKSVVARYRGIAWTAVKKIWQRDTPILRLSLRSGSGEHREELQQGTLPEKWKESSDEVEKKCKEITKVCDGIVKQAKEDNMTDMSKKGTALPDSANTSKRNVKDGLIGSRAVMSGLRKSQIAGGSHVKRVLTKRRKTQ